MGLSDTPRTDAWVKENGDDGLIYVDFARTLEVELSATARKLEEAERKNEEIMQANARVNENNEWLRQDCIKLKQQLADYKHCHGVAADKIVELEQQLADLCADIERYITRDTERLQQLKGLEK